MSDTIRTALTIGAVAAGMTVFALCAHQPTPWGAISAGGLIVAAAAIALPEHRARARQDGAPELARFGLGHLSRTTFIFMLAGAGIGAAAGLWHRYGLEVPLQPRTNVQTFVLLACVIGAIEELVYRGWLMERARVFGWPVAIVSAALAHAAYKTALFAWPAVPVPVDVWQILWMTTAGGLLLGVLRAWSGSVWPAVAAHVVFDFVVYRALAEAPWWVWE